MNGEQSEGGGYPCVLGGLATLPREKQIRPRKAKREKPFYEWRREEKTLDMAFPPVVKWDIPIKGRIMKLASDSEAKKRWDKENTVMVSIKFQKRTDGDIILFLLNTATPENTKQDIIKSALREYIENHKND